MCISDSSYTAQTWEPIIWQAVFVLATFLVVIRGVKEGIEKASKILMPILIVLSVLIAVYSVTLPGALEGVKYFFLPSISNFSVQTVLGALGQMFYSMSLAMGIMITYGAYLRKEDDLEGSVKHIELFDTGVAVLAGLMIIPAVFAFSGGDQSALNAGPGLMFVTLPKVFEKMGMSTDVYKRQSRLHPRCGTSFLIEVMIISVICLLYTSTGSVLIPRTHKPSH